MRPKFEVGEVVLLRSRNLPELNAEYEVEHLEVKNGRESVSFGGLLYLFEDYEVVYFLLGVVNPSNGRPVAWGESSLRKKHTPGEMSFDNLIQSLSSPKLLTHQPQ